MSVDDYIRREFPDMFKKHKCFIIILSLIISSTLIIGCGNTDAKSNAAETYDHTDDQNIEVIPLPDDLASPSEDSLPITLTFANLCGTDIGMFSMIDPNTEEQINLMPLADQETVSIEANWPKDNMNFQWALYNAQGELCIEATSDLTGITSSALIVVTGDGDVESVDVTIE